MKQKFGWYYPLSKEEMKKVWDEAILTVDANVLLDLYRYHVDTRDALLAALELFEGRVWLSHQSAEEFFRNRKKVIISSIDAYDEAIKSTSEIGKNVEEPLRILKNNRIISDNISESIRSSLEAALISANEAIVAAKEKHPNFLNTDPILEKLSVLFNGSVGEGFSEVQLANAIKEGRRRVELKIPPGFMDSGKDGIRPYGDYFMWEQILDYAATKKAPLIFVTSEGKEDWWEKTSGKTIGLHYELLKEAYSRTGNVFLAYRTDRFFMFSEEHSGQGSNKSAAEEISALVEARSTTNEPVILRSTQIETTATPTKNIGRLVVITRRPSMIFSCHCRVNPQFNDIPEVTARLVSHPENMPDHMVRAGAGTIFDFNLHVRSSERDINLPVGEYIFEYEALVENSRQLDE